MKALKGKMTSAYNEKVNRGDGSFLSRQTLLLLQEQEGKLYRP